MRSRKIENHTKSGFAYLEDISKNGDGSYHVKMSFSTSRGAKGCREYKLRTNSEPVIEEYEFGFRILNGQFLELYLEELGKSDHFSPQRLDITKRLFGISFYQ